MANAELAKAWIQLVPSFRGLQGNIAKEFDAVPTDRLGKNVGSRFTGGVSKGLAKLGGTVAAAFAAKKVADFFADSMDAVKNWQVLNAQTEAVVKSTGGAANITAKQVHELAGSLEGLTATQAESIQEGANMLLTFKNIQNRVGEGNDIFNRATEALVDMSRAMGTDPQQAAIQLGKALNDPIQGVSALSRVGIQFTDDQKALIKSLWETGDAAGAQKVILEELNDQFGGSGAAYADTYAGKLFLLNDAFGDIGEELVTKLMPNLEKLIDWLREDGIVAVEDFADGMSDVFEGIEKVSEQEWYKDFVASLDTGGELDLVGGGFVDNFKTKWEQLPQSFANGWEQIKAAFSNGWAQITAWWNSGWDHFPKKLENGRQQINTGVTNLWNGLMGKFANGWAQITGWWNSGWDGFGRKLENGRQQINTGVTLLVDGMAAKFRSGWDQITGAFSNGWEQIKKFMGWVGGVVEGAKKKFEAAGKGIRDAFRGIGQFLKDAFKPITDLMGGVGNAFKTFFGGAGDRARHIKGMASTMGGTGTGSGGPALARVRASMPSGLRVTDTLSNPARDRALGLKRSPNSYHYDAKNPAVDIAGPTYLLHQYAKKLRAMGGWRQLLWQVPGHYDHIHVAHTGGVVQSSWYRSPGDKWDERTVRLQVGETVLPKGVSPVNAAYEVAPGSSGPRTVILQVGDREFEAYLSEVADGRIGAYDGARARRGVLGYGGPV